MGSLTSEFSRGSAIALTLLSRLKDIFSHHPRHFLFMLWEMLCNHSNFANSEVSERFDFANESEGSHREPNIYTYLTSKTPGWNDLQKLQVVAANLMS